MRKTAMRSPMGKLVVTKGLVLAAALVGAPSALAGDFVCTGGASGPLDNVVVPPGATCNMSNANVEGNVKVFGSLNVFAPTTIRGSIDGEPGHGFVRLFGGAILVHGNVQIKGSAAGIGAGYLSGTQIRGNFQWEENTNSLVATGGTIGENVKAEKNTGGGSITGNTIGENLECKENFPAIVEFGNAIGGDNKCPE